MKLSSNKVQNIISSMQINRSEQWNSNYAEQDWTELPSICTKL